jgi:hypothetical protein
MLANPWVPARCASTHGYGRQLRFAREHIESLRDSPASSDYIPRELVEKKPPAEKTGGKKRLAESCARADADGTS